jgi:hypothetical protein
MRTPERSRTATSAASWEHCQQRQDLLARLREALQDFGTAVQESRNRGPSGGADRTEAAGALCAEVWADLCKHQDEHGCWRQPQSSK